MSPEQASALKPGDVILISTGRSDAKMRILTGWQVDRIVAQWVTRDYTGKFDDVSGETSLGRDLVERNGSMLPASSFLPRPEPPAPLPPSVGWREHLCRWIMNL